MTAKENNFIEELERVIKDRAESIDINKSYTKIFWHLARIESQKK